MKINKYLLAGALSLGVASMASAAGTVYFTGSTAIRGFVFTVIKTPGVVFTAAPTTTLYQGSGSSANYMAFSGTLVGGSGTTILQCHWSGSDAGISDVAQNSGGGAVTEAFIDPGTAPGLDGNDHGAALPPGTIQHTVDLAMADNDQQFAQVYGNNPGTPPAALTTSAEVCVITFKWLRNPGLWTGTNVTSSQIRQAFGGFCKQAVFTGVATDTNNYVYMMGRDNGSGTRVNAFGDSGFGVFTVPNQIEIDSTGNMIDVNLDGTYEGDFGFSSGGLCANVMGGVSTAAKTDKTLGKGSPTGFSIVTYLGFGDATTALGLTPPAVELSYNGVPFSVANVKEGTYTYWGNEYIFKGNTVSTADATKVYNLLSASTGIPANVDGTKAINLTTMHCTRTGPDTDPTHN